MKTNAYFLGAALTLGVLSFTSCSEDDSIVAEDTTQLKPLTLVATSEDDSNDNTAQHGPLRAGMAINYDKNGSFYGDNNLWYAEDVVWAYSPSKKTFNKLVAQSSDQNGYGQTKMSFASGSNSVDYTEEERLILFNCGVQDGSINATGQDYNLKLTRSTDDNDMAIVYGNGTGTPYSDAGNAFSLRRSSAVVVEGDLRYAKSNTTTNVTAFMSASPKLMLEIPAKDDTDVQALSKLTYQIIVSLSVAEENDEGEEVVTSGFPSEEQLTFVTKSPAATKAVEVFDVNNINVTMGNDLKVKYTADATEVNKKSSSLWNTTSDAKDQYKGYVFIPIPCTSYSGLTVKVKVSQPATGGDESLNDICGVYTLSYSKSFLSTSINDASVAAKVWKLGAIWNRTSSSNNSSAKPAGFGNSEPHWVFTPAE